MCRSAIAMPTAVAMPLAERAGGGFDAFGDEIFWMARCPGIEPTELLDVLNGHRLEAGEIQQRVNQHRAVAGRQYKTIPVGPFRLRRVEFQELGVQHGGDIGRAHRRRRVAYLGLFDRVHRQRARMALAIGELLAAECTGCAATAFDVGAGIFAKNAPVLRVLHSMRPLSQCDGAARTGHSGAMH